MEVPPAPYLSCPSIEALSSYPIQHRNLPRSLHRSLASIINYSNLNLNLVHPRLMVSFPTLPPSHKSPKDLTINPSLPHYTYLHIYISTYIATLQTLRHTTFIPSSHHPIYSSYIHLSPFSSKEDIFHSPPPFQLSTLVALSSLISFFSFLKLAYI